MTYELDATSVRNVCAGALASHPSSGRFVAFAVGPADPIADVVRTVERQVFEASFGNDAATMAAEYGPYEGRSVFFLVVDRKTGLPAAAGRTIDGGGKTLDDAPALIGRDRCTIAACHDLHRGRIWDFATLAVLPAYRGRGSGFEVSSLLLRSFMVAGRRADVQHLVTLLDHHAHANMVRIGVVYTSMAGSGPFPYLGSKSTRALYVRFGEVLTGIGREGARLRRIDRTLVADLRSRGLRGVLARFFTGRLCGRIASGDGLDEHIVVREFDWAPVRPLACCAVGTAA